MSETHAGEVSLAPSPMGEETLPPRLLRPGRTDLGAFLQSKKRVAWRQGQIERHAQARV